VIGRRPCVAVADPLASVGLDLLREHAEVVEASDMVLLRGALTRSDALIVRSRTQVTPELLDSGPGLRLIGRAGIGVDNIDVPAATDRGILVINAPLGNVRSTAEHTIALIFALARRLVSADHGVRDGRWKSDYQGTQLLGKRLGIIGAGKVGRQVAEMALAVGLDVTAFDPYLSSETWTSNGLQQIGLDELIETSDIVTLHVPLMEETRGLLGQAELARMKPGAFVINCARGGLVDERALADALVEGRLGGAALDVFVDEPVQDSPLLGAPNLILTPHVAASTREAQDQVAVDIAAQVIDFFAGKPVAYPVNLAALSDALP
jgi:D-3-phosphoglycerate dehydrogenase